MDAGERAVQVIRRLKHTKGQWAGQPFMLRSWQEKIVRDVFGTLLPTGARQYRTVYVEVPRKNGKALAVDTPMLTAKGWSTMGDLVVGDEVFAPDGILTQVLSVSDVFTGNRCYRVTLSDGRSVVADAAHEWRLYDRYLERFVTVDTETVSGRYRVGSRPTHRERRYSVPVPDAVQLPERELLIDPYVIGVWLGDGSSAKAEITGADCEIHDSVRAAGYESSYVYQRGKASTIGFLGLKHSLDKLGVIGNKHVPSDYLLGAEQQRRDVLAGLLDTDGSVCLGNGNPRVEFTSTKLTLAESALFLARSLGWKATLTTGRAMLYGADCGPKYRVCFSAWRDDSPFRLNRKTERLPARPKKATRSMTIQVAEVEEVASVPTRCIQVDGGMYLGGPDLVPTHNSELAAAIATVLLFADDEAGAEIYSAAADRDQASIVFDVAAAMVRQSASLSQRAKVIPSTKRIIYKDSVYRVLSAEHATKHGFNAHGVIFDELHTQPNRSLWDVLTTSGGTRRQPLTVAITTAGYDRNSICWEVHEYARKILAGIIKDPTFYAVIYAAPEEADWTDETVWAAANPALGDFRDIEEMRALCARAQETPALQNTFRRLYLNQWTRQADRWLSVMAWDASAGEVFPEDLWGERCYGGLDLASTTDLAAFVLVFPDEEYCFDVLPFFWVPEDAIDKRSNVDRVPYRQWVQDKLIEATPGNVIDYRWIRKRIGELGEQYNIREIAFDRWGATEIIQNLGDDGFTVAEFGQGFASMASPTQELLKLVLGKRLRHGGHPVLRWMADNMVVRQDPAGNVKPDKAKSTERIDGMVALIMGLDRALRNEASVYDERGMLSV